jgi:hypothetical protein
MTFDVFMIHGPTAPWAHLVFDALAWSGGIATSVVLYRSRQRDAGRSAI